MPRYVAYGHGEWDGGMFGRSRWEKGEGVGLDRGRVKRRPADVVCHLISVNFA